MIARVIDDQIVADPRQFQSDAPATGDAPILPPDSRGQHNGGEPGESENRPTWLSVSPWL